MNYNIRKLRENEHKILAEFLYEAIYIPEGVEAPPKNIIEQPELQLYISDWGKEHDYCLVAEVNDNIVGAAWTRIMNDYGHIDDKTPSFAISLYKEYRGMGMGTELMKQMLSVLKENGYEKASLSVQRANYAYKMYLKLGFEIISENEEEFLMIIKL
ncbi:MAG: GNAT family N-acetyltransferase [Lachnospiraceae bacterium]|nr:GNAT family N-acetyltransferase [Lachnospiraceae bacterium]